MGVSWKILGYLVINKRVNDLILLLLIVINASLILPSATMYFSFTPSVIETEKSPIILVIEATEYFVVIQCITNIECWHISFDFYIIL